MSIYQEVIQILSENKGVLIFTVIEVLGGSYKHAIGLKGLIGQDGTIIRSSGIHQLDEAAREGAVEAWKRGQTLVITAAINDSRVRVMLDPLISSPHLLILGGGHIAQPLAHFAKILGFQVTVVDDRPSFANRERFPDTDNVVCQSFGEFLDQYEVLPGTYIVIVTRGHVHDEECLRRVVGKPAAYIGMIGSKRRVAGVMKKLIGEGYDKEALERVHAPIGLPIAAVTPEEIALSIMAEVVGVRRGADIGKLRS